MKGSGSGPSSSSHYLLRSPWAAIVVAAVFLLLHLPSLAPALEDIDSINFALGLRDYDLARHQPHPPGYPVYIALGRVSHAAIAGVAPQLPAVRAEAMALAVWSALGGAVAIVAAWALFAAVRSADRRSGVGVESGRRDGWPLWAASLMAVTPLFWMTGLRPMSDMSGLALALMGQALLAQALFGRGGLARGAASDRWALIAGAAVAGVALGIRSQTVWLTAPLLVVALGMHWRRSGGAGIGLILPVAALAIAVLAWAVPMLAASGGVDGYLAALGIQADEDLSGVDMLLFNPTPRRLAFALLETFVLPWGLIAVAVVALVVAAVGLAVMALRERRALLLLTLAFAPYAVFHLLVQETVHVRYALPLVPAMAWLVARGAAVMIGGPGSVGPMLYAALAALPIVLLAGLVSVPAGLAYGREAHPAFRAIADIDAAIAAGDRPAAVFSHYALRRPLQAAAPSARVVEPRRSYEWLDMLDYWVEGGREPVWFLADPKRTDLALIDPASRRQAGRALQRQYRWSVGARAELGGTRPVGVDWYRFDNPPGWFAAEGWSLTPETGGLAKATTMGVDREPIDAYVRRRPGPMRIVVGVRHLGPGGPATVFELAIDQTLVERWTLDPAAATNELRFIELPNGLPPGPGDFARLTITARSAVAGQPTPEVAIRQFDIQPASTLVFGFGEGWHEAEYDTATGSSWRWTSERSVLRVAPPRAVRLTLRGESPLKYVDAPPRVRVTAAGRVIGELRPDDDFTWSVDVPADAVAAAGGAIAIDTDKVYLPGAAEGTADARRLGLRLFEIAIDEGSR